MSFALSKLNPSDGPGNYIRSDDPLLQRDGVSNAPGSYKLQIEKKIYL